MIAYIIYFLISIIMGIILLLVSVFNSKIRTNYYYSYKQLFELSKLFKNRRNQHQQILMFHAASSGEYEQIKPILRGIDRTNFFIVQTFTSPSIYNTEENSTLYDIKCYHPFDVFWLSFLFFKIINPVKYIVTRHDLWPGHILMAKYFQIPIYYINANIHQNSIWYNQSVRFIARYFLKKINYFVVPSIYIKDNLYDILPTAHCKVLKDTRFNQIIYIKNNKSKNNKLDTQLTPQCNKVITFGSIDEKDERVIFKALPILIKGKKIILVPHEVDNKNIIRIERKLGDLSLSYEKFSNRGIDLSKDILLVDVLGVLAQLYSLGDHAYVGGGFKRGVHSVLEPAAYGCLLACGPNIEMLDEAKSFKNKGYLSIVHNERDLVTFSNISTSIPNFIGDISDKALDMVGLLLAPSNKFSSNYRNHQ